MVKPFARKREAKATMVEDLIDIEQMDWYAVKLHENFIETYIQAIHRIPLGGLMRMNGHGIKKGMGTSQYELHTNGWRVTRSQKHIWFWEIFKLLEETLEAACATEGKITLAASGQVINPK
jgi:hypothetical protein